MKHSASRSIAVKKARMNTESVDVERRRCAAGWRPLGAAVSALTLAVVLPQVCRAQEKQPDPAVVRVENGLLRGTAGDKVIRLAWSAIYTDRMFACPQLMATRALAKRATTFAYEFADPNAPGLIPFLPGFPSGASHSGELPFLFDLGNKPLDITSGKKIPLTEMQKTLAATMIRYWTRFARTGDPNGDGTPHWPRFNADEMRPPVQVLASGSKGVEPTSSALAAHQYEFWAPFIDRSFLSAKSKESTRFPGSPKQP